MKLSAILAPLIAAKVPGDVILDTVRAYEAEQEVQQEKSRAKQKARWDRWREGDKGVAARGSKRLQTLAGVGSTLAPDPAHVEDNLQTKNQAGQKTKQTNTPTASMSDLDAFRCELAADLDAERLDALIKHRRTKRGQMSRP